MIKFWRGLVAAAAACATLLGGAPAWASYVVKDGSGATQTFCSNIAGGVHTPCHVIPDVSATGTLNAATANAAYTVTLGAGQGVVAFTVSGITAAGATLTVEGSNDTATWSTITKVDGGTGVLATTITADGQFRVNAGGRRAVRLRISATGTGTITISSNASTASSETTLTTPLPPGSNHIGTVSLDASSAPGAASTDRSGTIATGGAYQTVLASSATRKGCLIQNPPAATEVLNVKVGTMAAPFVIPAGGSFSCYAGSVVVTDSITATAATTGHAFTAVSQ